MVRLAMRTLLVLVLWTTVAASSVAATDLSGSWSGGWYSCTNGHRGPLQATFCRQDESHYVVHFRGRFLLNLIPFRYSVVLNVVEETDDSVRLEGSSYLGRLAGTFTYDATATATTFHADYDSCRDTGYFWLNKCCD
jgi:hypothetical protein